LSLIAPPANASAHGRRQRQRQVDAVRRDPGRLGIDAGTIEAPPPARIAHVAQDIDAVDQPALDYVLGGHAPLTTARAELGQAETQHDEMRLAHAHAALAELNEGAITASAMAVMHGLGFADSDHARAVSSFSGGWRNRLALARAR
jgi:ATP-binding cassette subfamily F protein 3